MPGVGDGLLDFIIYSFIEQGETDILLDYIRRWNRWGGSAWEGADCGGAVGGRAVGGWAFRRDGGGKLPDFLFYRSKLEFI